MEREQIKKGVDLIERINKLEKELSVWEECEKFSEIVISSKERRYEASIFWVDFDTTKSITICKLKKKLKELNDEFKAL
jgi:hypothetical protein